MSECLCHICRDLKAARYAEFGAPTMSVEDIWTPDGVTQLGGTHAAVMDTGDQIDIWDFVMQYKGRTSLPVKVIWSHEVPRSQIEDAIGQSMRNFQKEVDDKIEAESGKHTPTDSERKDIGLTLKEIAHYQERRTASGRTRDELYYGGI